MQDGLGARRAPAQPASVRPFPRIRACCALVSVALATTACAQDELASAAADEVEVAPAHHASRGDGSQRARKTAAELLSRAPHNLKYTKRSDGTTHVKVLSGFKYATFLVSGPDGGVTRNCLGDEREAAHLHRKGAP